MSKVRVGIIGAGFGAKVHAPIMKLHHGFEVVSIASVTGRNTYQLSKDTSIDKVYSNWREMLQNEKLDLISIASAPYLHKEMVLEAYSHGIDVLCEKPMALNSNESLEMLKAKEMAGRLGFINFEFRFFPARLKVKEIMDSGQLGRILHINYRGMYQGYYRNLKRKYWLGEKEKGGGMLGALGSHMIDAIMWWKNSIINSVYGQLPIQFPEYIDEGGTKEVRTAEDSFHIIGDFPDGATFNLDFVLSSRNLFGWSLEIYGTNGTLKMRDDSSVELGLKDEPLSSIWIEPLEKPTETLSDYTAKYYGAFKPFLDNLYHAVKEKKINPNLATFEDGYRAQTVLDAVNISAEEGRKIHIVHGRKK